MDIDTPNGSRVVANAVDDVNVKQMVPDVEVSGVDLPNGIREIPDGVQAKGVDDIAGAVDAVHTGKVPDVDLSNGKVDVKPEIEGGNYSSLRDLMSPEEVARYDGYWNKVGYDKAITARNMLIQNTVDANKKAVAIGAYDIETGNVTAKFAGAIPDTINNQLIERANLIGGIGSKGINGKNTVGVCAEFQAANELLNNGGNLTNIRFTEAVRPRTGKVIPTCSNCIEMFYESFK